MRPKQSKTCLSSSGRVITITNHVAFFDKESVHKDFHPLMDFLKNSPVSYALTATPTIYAEIVEEMWSKADCSVKGEIKFTITGKSYTITPSVINEALRLPNSNFESLPTDEEIISMLMFIEYASIPWHLSEINRKYLRKEWLYFFDTLSKVFTSRFGGYVAITKFVLIIGYSLMYNRTIDIGSLLLDKFSKKLGNKENRYEVIDYARFFMIIANHLCKELSVRDRDDTLQVCVQPVSSFPHLVLKNLNAKVKFVLPDHIQAQLSTLYPSHSHTTSSPVHNTKDPIPPIKVTLPSQSPSRKEATSVCGKRKKIAPPTITVGTSEKNEEATEFNPPKKKVEASTVIPQTGLLDVDPEMSPGCSRDGVLVVELHSSPENEKKKCNLCFVLEHTLEPDSPEEDIPQDRQQLVNQHLMNTASILKSQLVACLTSSADKLSPNDMINLANKSYNALRAIGDDYSSFSREVNKLIAHRRMLAYAAKNKEKIDRDIKASYMQQEMSLSVVSNKLFGAQERLFRAETYVESLKLKREELTGALLKLTEELSEEEKRVENLAAERDLYKEVHSDVEAELRKLDMDKEEVRVAFEEVNDKYYAAKDELERMNSQLLQLVRK